MDREEDVDLKVAEEGDYGFKKMVSNYQKTTKMLKI